MTLLINDFHAGMKRSAGVTPTSLEALRAYQFSAMRELLAGTQERHLTSVGDLFDSFEVDTRDWLETYMLLHDWLARGRSLTLVAGNHDVSKRGDKVSSFESLCTVLVSAFHGQVQVVAIDQWDEVWNSENLYALAHCSNQDRFDLQLDELLGKLEHGATLLLHANYHNHFASCSDHSLNVSEEVAKKFIDRGITLAFAHEHQARREMPQGSKQTGAEVLVFGNQVPTAIADCLGNDRKYAHVLSNGHLSKVETWRRDGEAGFAQVNWRDLADYDGDAGFIRVCGEAKASEAADVLNLIAKFRQKSDAFVVSNAVEIEGVIQQGELKMTAEQAKGFDVPGFVRERLDDWEFELFETLLKKSEDR
jgi:hypothetical protein